MACMREAGLWGDRYRHLVGGDQDRLPELTVPRPVLLLDAFEGCELELGSVDEGGDGGEILAVVAGDGFADSARGDIGLIVDRQDQAAIVLLEVVVHLGRAPFLVAGTPGGGGETGGTGDGPRVRAATIGHIRAEQ